MHGMNRFKNIQEKRVFKPGTHQQRAVHLHRQQETERPDIGEELIRPSNGNMFCASQEIIRQINHLWHTTNALCIL